MNWLSKPRFLQRNSVMLMVKQRSALSANICLISAVLIALLGCAGGASYHAKQAIKYNNHNDVDGAIASYTQAIALAPDTKSRCGYLKDRGITRHNQWRHSLDKSAKQDIAGAEADFNEAIRLCPEDSNARSIRALFFANNGQPQRALEDYNYLIAQDPRNASLLSQRALAHAAIGDSDKALADITKAIDLSKGTPASQTLFYRNRAQIRLKFKDTKGAIEDYNYLIAQDPRNASLLSQRALAYATIDDSDKALTEITKAIDLSKGTPASQALFYRNRAQIRLKFKDTKGALTDLDTSIVVGNSIEKCNGLMLKGLVLELDGQISAALTAYEQSLNESENIPIDRVGMDKTSAAFDGATIGYLLISAVNPIGFLLGATYAAVSGISEIYDASRPIPSSISQKQTIHDAAMKEIERVKAGLPPPTGLWWQTPKIIEQGKTHKN